MKKQKKSFEDLWGGKSFRRTLGAVFLIMYGLLFYADMEYSVCQFTPVNIVSKACLGIGLICLLIDSIYSHTVSKPAGESSQTEKSI